MEQKYDDVIEIDMKEILFSILTSWKLLLFSGILMAAVVFAFNTYVLTPKYEATSKLYVFPKNSLSSFADIQLGDSLTQDYMEVITGRPVVEEVIKNLKLEYDYEEMLDNMRVENPTDTRILKITITDESAMYAKTIADEFATVSAEYISDRMDQDSPNILEWAYLEEKPVGPKVHRNTCLGFIGGVFLMSVAIATGHLFNDTLSNAEDMERYLGLNTLAEIPDSVSVEEKRKKRDKKKGKK